VRPVDHACCRVERCIPCAGLNTVVLKEAKVTADTVIEEEFTLNGKSYFWSFDDGVLCWAESSTCQLPLTPVSAQLTRLFLDTQLPALFEIWGRDNLRHFHYFLKAHSATKADYERLGIGNLLTDTASELWKPRSPLHYMGYRVGETGIPEAERRNILLEVIAGELPNVGDAKYMSRWGYPGTQSRLRSVISHLWFQARLASQEYGINYKKAVADWNSDVQWLMQFADQEQFTADGYYKIWAADQETAPCFSTTSQPPKSATPIETRIPTFEHHKILQFPRLIKD
jgi:hypothetical protein